MPAEPADDSLALALRVVRLGRELRAEDPVLMDVRGLVDYTDFFLLLTGRSARQNQAIADHVVRSLKSAGRRALSKSGLDVGSWICIDLGDVVVHVFDPPTRDRYDLELLWADAPRVDAATRAAAAAREPSSGAPPAPPARAPGRRRAARKAAVADADEANAPDSERPADDEEAPPEKPAPKKRSSARRKKPL
jgi:ribosome-associated protein